jgi:hypothetical protein
MKAEERHLIAILVALTGGGAILTLLGAVLTGFMDSPVLTLRLAIASATCAVLVLIFGHRARTLAKHRRLDAMQRAELLHDARKLAPVPIVVSAPKDDEEAQSLRASCLGCFGKLAGPPTG